MQPILVTRGYRVEVPVSLAFNVSDALLISHIVEEDDPDSDVIAEWDVTYMTDGTDGEILLTLTPEVTEAITADTGFMFLRSVGEFDPIDLFDELLEVEFVDP